MNPDPLATNDHPMKVSDAALVALFLTLALLGSVYYPTHPYEAWVEDPGRCAYELFWIAIIGWAAEFGVLSGLTAYAKQRDKVNGSGGE